MERQTPDDINRSLAWVENFERVARLYKGQFGISDAVLAQIGAVRAEMDNSARALGELEAAVRESGREITGARFELFEVARRHVETEQAYKAALEEKARVVQEAAQYVGPLVARLQRPDEKSVLTTGDLTGSHQSVLSMLTSVTTDGSISGLVPPSNLTVRAQPNRVNVLQWEANGNSPDVRYIVEATAGNVYRGVASEPDRTAFRVVAVVPGATVYSHQLRRAPPGTRIIYRVRAEREKKASRFSNEVSTTCL
jgi:hypothetical protein